MTSQSADAEKEDHVPVHVQLGKLLDESHASCRDYFDCSCEELDELTTLSKKAGAWGSRLTGADAVLLSEFPGALSYRTLNQVLDGADVPCLWSPKRMFLVSSRKFKTRMPLSRLWKGSPLNMQSSPRSLEAALEVSRPWSLLCICSDILAPIVHVLEVEEDL